jgi:L-threonylcarbamoyladenylate synthase
MRVYLAVELILKAGMAAYNEGAKRIADGGLVAFPTETVYGLGADAGNGEAVARIFAAKERPTFNPLIVHVTSRAEAVRLADMSPTAERLAEAFWPGALTLVLPRKADAGLSDLVTAGLGTVAIRVPAHAVAHEFLDAVERPIAAPSANRSGRVSPTTAAHVAADLDGRVDLIIDGGPTTLGLESTIVAVEGETVRLLRPGGATVEDIERVLGYPMEKGEASDERPTSPGQLRSHYAPRLPVRLNAGAVSASEALLAFGRPLDGAAATLNLSEDENLTEAAANLFAMLRQLDDKRFSAIAVMPVPANGLGLAINDRLHRAAAPRPEDDADD